MTYECNDCGQEFDTDEDTVICPECGSDDYSDVEDEDEEDDEE